MATAKKYTTLADELRKDILSGKYGWEGGLPEESELVQKHNLARGTVRAAITLLEGEGLITQRGRNYYVNRIPYPMSGYVPPVVVRMQEMNKKGYIKNVGSVKRVLLPAYLSGKIGKGTYDAVFQVCVVGEITDDGQERPTQLGHYYYLMPVSDDQFARMLNDPSVDPVSETGPENLTRDDEITSRFPTQQEAEMLNIPVSTPAMGCLSIVRDEEKNVLLIQEDIFSHRLTFMYSYSFVNRPTETKS